MKRNIIVLLLIQVALAVSAQQYDYLTSYNQARKFTASKLSTMLFSTKIDPHWTPKGDKFWYEYKTSQGSVWYIVNPAAKTKKTLFDQDKLASDAGFIPLFPAGLATVPGAAGPL